MYNVTHLSLECYNAKSEVMVVVKGEAGAKRGYLSRETMARIIKEAHAICKDKVPVESHRTPAGRTRLGKPRDKYLNCLRETIQQLVKKRLQELGIKVA